MKRTHKYAACLLLGGLVMASLAGCTNSTDEKTGDAEGEERALQIGVSFDSFVIERWLRDRDVFVSTANELGAEVNIQNAGGDVQTQIEQIQYLIDKKVDVINIVAIDGNQLSDVIKTAKDAGIKVVCYDRLIHNANADLYISFDNEEVGTLMAETLIEALPDGGKIFAIYGSDSDENVSMVEKGLTETLEGTGIEIVYSSYCANWLAELAFEYTEEALEEYPDVDAVMCGNDDLASQAIRALSEQRLAGKIPVVAQDAELAACQRIVEGTQTMTVFKSVDEEARSAAILSVALARGEDITSEECEIPVTGTINDGTTDIPCYELTPVAVTADNLDEVIVDTGFHRAEEVYLNVADAQN